MSASILPPGQAKQYVVELPSSQESIAGLSNLKQSDLEKNLSTGNRRVVTLDEFQLAELKRQNPTAIVFENARVRVPTPEELGAKPVFDVREPGAVGPAAVTDGIQVHGADKLQAQGIKGNSSQFSPIVVTVDTGIAPHQFLETDQRGLKFWDVFDAKEEPWKDGESHGTHVSGIMFADGSMKGMAPDAQFMGIKVLDDTGNGTIASVMSGLDKAAQYYDEIAKPAG